MSFYKSRLFRSVITICCVMVFGIVGLRFQYYFKPIPKIIHYVWVGPNPMPENFPNVLASWQKYAPDYRLHKIDETECDVQANAFVRQAYAQKSYNFVSDYCRFVALEKEGGLYLDTDHVLFESPTKSLQGAKRILTLEKIGDLSGSFIAVQPHDPLVQEMVRHYETNDFVWNPLPYVFTQYFKNVFPEQELTGFYEKYGTRILPVNLAMLNFGGGEAIAEHLYDNANAGIEQRGLFYDVFKNDFLENGTIHLCNGAGTKRFFILDTPKTGYLYRTNRRAEIVRQTSEQLLLKWADMTEPARYRWQKEAGCFKM